MTTTRINPVAAFAAVFVLAIGSPLAFIARADPPTTAERSASPKGKEAKPVAPAQPVAPGIQALAAASTDIVVVDVLETNPTKAKEGARDTVRLKVARTLLGGLAPGDSAGVDYHLLWTDQAKSVLEPPKFQQGKRYVVFLRSHVRDRGGEERKRVEYELTDPWLAVQPDHVELVKGTVVAVRAAHGDAAGAWSKAVGPLEGRLVLVRSGVSNGTPIIASYLELRNVAGDDNAVEFNPNRASITWIVTDEKGNEVAPTRPEGSWLLQQAPNATLPAGGRVRLALWKSGGAFERDRDGQLEPEPGRVWVFGRDPGKAYDLRGKVEVKSIDNRAQWSGTLDLPRVKIPTGRE